MTPGDIERHFAQLKFKRDVRTQPDERRRGQFRAGWRDAIVGGSYTETTLKQLTWRNLGYRFGQEKGSTPEKEIDAVYEVLAQQYATMWVARSDEDQLLRFYWLKVGGR